MIENLINNFYLCKLRSKIYHKCLLFSFERVQMGEWVNGLMDKWVNK